MKIKRGMYFCFFFVWNEFLYLNNTGYGDKIKDKMINNRYMDDLKLHARNYDELEGLLKIVKKTSFSDDVCMESRLDTFAKASFK